MGTDSKRDSNAGEAVSFELEVGEKGKSKYISLPLSYDFEFLPGNGADKPVTVSSVVSIGTQTIIKTSGSTARWRLKITKAGEKGKSGLDCAGNTTPIDDGENDDGPSDDDLPRDWLWEGIQHVEPKTRATLLNTKKSIVIQEEGA